MNYLLIVLSTFLLSYGSVFAESSIQLEPTKCITLNQGNTCYQNVKVYWESDIKGHYCLYQPDSLIVLKCWEGANRGDFKFEFQGAHSVYYQLLKMPSKEPMAQKKLSVKWVYKARRNQRWRLF